MQAQVFWVLLFIPKGDLADIDQLSYLCYTWATVVSDRLGQANRNHRGPLVF